jgi:hypothetical protein
MNSEQKKEALSYISSERLKAKLELKMISYLLKEGSVFEREMNRLLDRLSYLDKLEVKIKKMK